LPLNYSHTHFESLLRDAEEVFRFLWENRGALRLYEGAYTRVQSVRPCLRIDEYGRLKFHIHNRIDNIERQSRRLRALAEFGYFNKGVRAQRRFASLH